MCGIAGIVETDGAPVNGGVLERMISMLRHRGPDGSGVKLLGQAGLAHARLSIIDLSGGAQPMSNEDGSIWVTFNGEIYNYVELRADLESRGHVVQDDVRHRSDRPCLRGVRATAASTRSMGSSRLRSGTTRSRSLFLARDRFGKKPLYYCQPVNISFLRSEIKALLAHPAVDASSICMASTRS